MANEVTYDVRVYDLNGALKRQTTEALNHRTTIPLNGIDTFECDFYLDSADALSGEIKECLRVIKVWRTVTASGHTYTPPAGTPDFAGVITKVTKQGGNNIMHVVAQSPFWRLQSRFHLHNHYYVRDWNGSGCNGDNLNFDQSAMMWKLIDLINGAFVNQAGVTGIVKPTVGPPYWPKTIAVAPYRVPKGSNTYQHIFEDLMNRVQHADLTPEYIHTGGSPNLMYFKTAIKRGSDKSATVKLNFCITVGGIATNCDDMTEDSEIIPAAGGGVGFANYVWCVGQGGVNKSVGVAMDASGTYGRDSAGAYMKRVDQGQVHRVAAMRSIAQMELKKSKQPLKTYSAQISAMSPPYYKADFDVGDTIELNASKGAMNFTGVKQRIYQVVLSLSENCVETAALTLADDFSGP